MEDKNEVIQILINRDDMSYGEAADLVDSVIEQFENCGYDTDECEDILMSELNLEPDYLEYLIY